MVKFFLTDAEPEDNKDDDSGEAEEYVDELDSLLESLMENDNDEGGTLQVNLTSSEAHYVSELQEMALLV